MLASAAAIVQLYSSDDAVEVYSYYHLSNEEQYLYRRYLQPGARVLDLACGLARTTLRLHEMGFRVKGIDLSPRFIQIAQRRFPYLDLAVGSYLSIDEPSGSYDHVLISANGLDLAGSEEQRLKALREVHRVLRPGGVFLFSSHNIKSLYCSPYYILRPGGLPWMLQNVHRAFRARDFVLDRGRANEMTYLYSAPTYAIKQVEAVGFQFQEMVGLRMSKSPLFIRYISPYVHYAFIKKP